jgi:hypothetical protein
LEDKDNAMMRFRGAEQCSVDACHFYCAGGDAIRLDFHAQYIEVKNSLFHDLGASAVVLLGYGPGTKDVNKYNRIINNHIHDNGQIRWHSQQIILWQSGENLVAHNYIHHVPRMGIFIVGVRPSIFKPEKGDQREGRRSIRFYETGSAVTQKEILPFTHSRNNIIEYNHIHNALQKLGDGSPINLSGAGMGNIVRYNIVHDIYNAMADGCIRTDDAQDGTLITKNIVYNSQAPGICTKGKNVVKNNFVVNVSSYKNPYNGMIRALGVFGNSYVVNNIILSNDEKDLFYVFLKEAKQPEVYQMMTDNTVDKNVYFSERNPAFSENQTLVDLKKNGFDQNSLYTDPLFVNWREGDFRLKEGSPALKIGIEQIDIMDKVGLTKDFPKKFNKR